MTLWGFLLWATAQAIVVTTPPGLTFVAAIAVLSLGGAFAQDAKKKRLVGAPWKEWAANSSHMPFGAIGAGPWRWLG